MKMIKLTEKQIKKARGIIVWDFDRVLFDTERFYRGAKIIFKKYGVPSARLWRVVLKIRKDGGPFSTARALRILRDWKFMVPEKKIRKEIHNHLAATDYFTSETDALLHRLRRHGFIHIILSHGASSYFHKRVRVGCGEGFIRHFPGIFATHRPKHLFLLKLVRRYPALPIFFVDDTDKHIKLVWQNVPKVKALHYTKGWTLKKVEKSILSAIKK